MTFRAIIQARIRKTDATNERSAVRINRERLLVSTAFPVRLGVALFSFSPSDAQKAEPSTRGYLRDRLLYRHNPRGAYLGFLCLSVADSLSLSAPPPLCLSFTHSSPCRFSPSRPRNTWTYTQARMCSWYSGRNLFLHGVFPLSVSRSPTRKKARIRATVSTVSTLSPRSGYGIICAAEISHVARYPFQPRRLHRRRRTFSSTLNL